MNVERKIRQVVKWGGISVAAVVLGLWIASWRWSFGWLGSDMYVAIGRGEAVIGAGGPVGLHEGWVVQERSEPMLWWLDRAGELGSSYWWRAMPLWIPFAAAAVIGSWGWWVARVDRKVNAGICKQCGYDLAGIAMRAKCPECGAKA